MVKITYQNFKDIECKYVKYVSRMKNQFIFNIVDFQKFKHTLLEEYTEKEIEYFFKIFPYTLDSLISERVILTAIKLEIEYYEDLQLVKLDGDDYVLINEASEIFEDWGFLKKIESQPILLEDFVSIVFDDFVELSTVAFLSNIASNVKEKEKTAINSKYVDKGLEYRIFI